MRIPVLVPLSTPLTEIFWKIAWAFTEVKRRAAIARNCMVDE
jgi:hypothetical protein